MKQLTAKHPMSGFTIIQRFIDGVRYLKVIPKNLLPLVIERLKNQFSEGSVEVIQYGGWVRITRLVENEELNEKMKKKFGEGEVNEDFILNKEADMLKQQGFIVKIEEFK